MEIVIRSSGKNESRRNTTFVLLDGLGYPRQLKRAGISLFCRWRAQYDDGVETL